MARLKPKKQRLETIIHVRMNDEVLDALARLTQAVGDDVPNARSIAIRRAIIDAAARLDGKARR